MKRIVLISISLSSCFLLGSCGADPAYMAPRLAKMSDSELVSSYQGVWRHRAFDPIVPLASDQLVARGLVRPSMLASVRARKPQIGMTITEAKLALGYPSRQNSYTTAAGTMDQLVYDEYEGTIYLHFRGGKLSSIDAFSRS